MPRSATAEAEIARGGGGVAPDYPHGTSVIFANVRLPRPLLPDSPAWLSRLQTSSTTLCPGRQRGGGLSEIWLVDQPALHLGTLDWCRLRWSISAMALCHSALSLSDMGMWSLNRSKVGRGKGWWMRVQEAGLSRTMRFTGSLARSGFTLVSVRCWRHRLLPLGSA